MRCTLLVCTARKCFATTTHKEQNEDVDMGGEREDTRHISHMRGCVRIYNNKDEGNDE